MPALRDFRDVAVVIVAAGAGTRTGPGLPKQYRLLAGRPMLARTIERVALALPGVQIVPVMSPQAAELYRDAMSGLAPFARENLLDPVAGGATRQASVRAGLDQISGVNGDIKIVLIHDVARPFSSSKLLEEAISGARRHGAAIPALPVTDTVKIVNAVGQITGAADRSTLRTVQTPQAFSLPLILDAHRRAAAAGLDDFTDDAAVATWAGYPVHVVDGDPDNFKVTTMADFIRAEAQLLADRPDIRVGQGFDVHAFAPGDHVWLGGVRIPHDKTLDGHSDADVVIHAICDAIYGALAEGDIGAHFPPSDPRWRDVASELFLRHAVERVAARDGMIAHVDAAIVCEAPRIGPHRDAMRERLAAIMGVSLDRVAIKATTSEKLGFTGRREGIAVLTTVTLRLPLRA